MFYDLLQSGHRPKTINYKELVSDWIKVKVLLKSDELDCIEIEWLKKTIAYFCLHANFIWRKHRGKVTGLNVQKQHTNFLDKYIDATNLSPCTCAKCFTLEHSEIEQDQSSSGKKLFKISWKVDLKNISIRFRNG